jgi:preprotein translocase subunit SecD
MWNGTMGIRRGSINSFLALVLAAAAGTGCELTSKAYPDSSKKEQSTIRFYLESNAYEGMGTHKVQVIRGTPVEITVEKETVLDERDVARARVISTPGSGYAIAIEFTTHGQLVLGMESANNKGRRLAIYSEWGEARWLAAPVIRRPIEDGVFAFSPDATREESERIVRGLNNVAVKFKNQPKPGKSKKTQEDLSELGFPTTSKP